MHGESISPFEEAVQELLEECKAMLMALEDKLLKSGDKRGVRNEIGKVKADVARLERDLLTYRNAVSILRTSHRSPEHGH